MKDQSPFEAVTSWLKREFNIEPNNLQVMMLIDEVRQALPPKGDNTIAALRAILRSLEPHDGLDSWCSRMSEEIVRELARLAEVKQLAVAADNESFWCHLEGTLSGMLKRVTRGQNLTPDQLVRQRDHWKHDFLQFARLLTELNACHNNLVCNALQDSMDLEATQILNIFSRAEEVFESLKRDLMPEGKCPPGCDHKENTQCSYSCYEPEE